MIDPAALFFQGVCHQDPSHTLCLQGSHWLPACARCTGMHLAVLATYGALWIRGRLRATRAWPPWLLVFGVCVWALMGADVMVNLLWPEAPWANVRRLLTGLLVGMTLPLLLVPAASLISGWASNAAVSVMDQPRDLVVPLAIALGLAGGLLIPWRVVWIAIGWVSLGGLISILAHLNLVLLRLVEGSWGRRLPRPYAAVVVLAGLTICELLVLGGVRTWLESGWPSAVSQP